MSYNLFQYTWFVPPEYGSSVCLVSQIAKSVDESRQMIKTSCKLHKEYTTRTDFLRSHLIDPETDLKIKHIKEKMNDSINMFTCPYSRFEHPLDFKWLNKEQYKITPLFATMLISHLDG